MGRSRVKRKRQFPGATAYFDRHGVRRWRFRRGSFSRELGTEYGEPEFVQRYEAAVAGKNPPEGAGSTRTRSGTMNALIASWYQSPVFCDLQDSTKKTYRSVVEKLREQHGHRMVSDLRRSHIQTIIAKKSETPGAANFLLRMFRQLLDHAIDLELREDNPARLVKKFKMREGRHTWSEDEISQYYRHHLPGTLAHTAMTIMLYTGAARCDVVALGWGNVQDASLIYRRRKTRRVSEVLVKIPIAKPLADVLATLPLQNFTFLQTRQGKSRSPAGLGNDMRRWCDAAGLKVCTSHGLRRAMARRLAEHGATTSQIMAAGGWTTSKEVDRYTADLDRERAAIVGFQRMMDGLKGEHKVANHPDRFAKEMENDNG